MGQTISAVSDWVVFSEFQDDSKTSNLLPSEEGMPR